MTKVTPASANTQTPHPVWTERWCLPHESAFNRLQKFAWANFASANEIARDMFGKRPIGAFGTSARELFFGDWISHCAVNAPSGFTLQNGFVAAYGRDWMRLLAGSNVLRYCEPCLFEGFHSLLFQIEGLLKCPRHGAALCATCRHCGRPTASLALLPHSFERPFCCPQCRRPLTGTLEPRRWFVPPERRAHVADKLEPIVAWLQQLTQYSMKHQTTPLAQLSLAGEFAGESDAIVAFDVARRIFPLSLPADLCASARRPLRITRLRGNDAPSPVLKLTEHLRREAAFFRAIEKHVLRTCLQSHRSCLRSVREGILVESLPGTQRLLQRVGLCPVAAGFVRWRTRFWIQAMEWRKWHWKGMSEDVREFRAPTAWGGANLLAQFYSCVATAYVCELLLRTWARGGVEFDRVYGTILGSYSSGWDDADALWMLAPHGESSAETMGWLISGDARILEAGRSIGHCEYRGPKLEHPARRRRRITREVTQMPSSPTREVWHDSWVLPYESALSVLLKYVNDNPDADLRWGELVGGFGRLLWGPGPRRLRPAIAAGDAMLRGALRTYAPRWRCGLLTATRVRVCPACSALGYHSAFFQILELQSCPMHGLPLQESCPACEHQSRLYEPTTKSFLHHLRCQRCHGDLVGSAGRKDADQAAELRARIGVKLTPLAHWIQANERTHRVDPTLWSRPPIPELKLHPKLVFARHRDSIR